MISVVDGVLYSAAGAGQRVAGCGRAQWGRRRRHILRGDGDARRHSHLVQGRAPTRIFRSRDSGGKSRGAARRRAVRRRSVFLRVQEHRRHRIAPRQTRRARYDVCTYSRSFILDTASLKWLSKYAIRANTIPDSAVSYHAQIAETTLFLRAKAATAFSTS